MFVLNVMALFSVSFGVSVTISFISVVISVQLSMNVVTIW